MKHSLPNLDGLRALAILPVLGLHASYGILRGGFLGVDLFFVLSGFLITRLLYRELQETTSINLRYFYARRALRLFPATIAALALASALWSLTADANADLSTAALSVIFYYSNLIDGRLLGTLGSAWSLAIEEQFYLIWPVALFGLFRFFHGRRRPLLYCILGTVVLVVLFRAAMYHYAPQALDLYRFTFSRVDSLLAGAMAALVITSRRLKNPRTARVTVAMIVSLFVIATCVCSQTAPAFYYGGFTFAALLFAALVTTLSQMPPLWFFSHPLMIWIGRRSYGLYLYHLPIFQALEVLRVPGNQWNLIWVTLLRFGLSFLAAALSYRFLEKPFLALRGREISRRIMVFILVRPQDIVCETWDAKNRALSESTHRCRMGDRAPPFSRPRQAGPAAAV